MPEELTKATFQEKVFNYEQNKEWKFEGNLPVSFLTTQIPDRFLLGKSVFDDHVAQMSVFFDIGAR